MNWIDWKRVSDSNQVQIQIVQLIELFQLLDLVDAEAI